MSPDALISFAVMPLDLEQQLYVGPVGAGRRSIIEKEIGYGQGLQ